MIYQWHDDDDGNGLDVDMEMMVNMGFAVVIGDWVGCGFYVGYGLKGDSG